jgi:S-DNA-T family DNA segregation ATPase FtsK/SpoIIIE
MNSKKGGDPIEQAVTGIFRAFGGFWFNVFRGIRSLKRISVLLGFVITVTMTAIAVKNQQHILSLESVFNVEVSVYLRYAIYWFCLLLPLIYLSMVGSVGDVKAKKYYKMFEEIGFKGRNGKYPHFVKLEKADCKVVLHFKSNIPAIEWRKNTDRLESALNCSVRRIEQSEKSKKIVKLTTVSTDYQIPKMIRWDDKFIDKSDGVMVIGVSDLDTLKFDLNRTPHVLAAGETGSGKSVILRCMLWQMINKGCRIYMIDFKGGVEFGKAYEQYGEVITERERALVVLEMLVNENEKRLNLFRDLEVKNLKEYNQKTGSNLCRIGVFCDEIAEMLDTKGVAKSEKQIYEKLEGALSTLARLSRATGINLFLGVQRPDANVLTGQIKNNVPVRISGRFADKAASEIVLGNTSACDLPDIKGRFIYKMGNETIEFQSYYFDDDKDLRDREELEQDLGITQGDLLTYFESAPKIPDTIPTTPLLPERPPKRGDENTGVMSIGEEEFEFEY